MGFFKNLFKKKDLSQAHLGISSTWSKRDLKVYSFENYKKAYPELYKALASPSIKIIAIGISPLSEQRGLIMIKHPKLGFIFEGSDISPMVAKVIFANISGLYENKNIDNRLVKVQTTKKPISDAVKENQ